jgi:hypothetical protein
MGCAYLTSVVDKRYHLGTYTCPNCVDVCNLPFTHSVLLQNLNTLCLVYPDMDS